MFGKRAIGSVSTQVVGPRVAAGGVASEQPKAPPAPAAPVQAERRSEIYFQTKSLIFGALIEAIDLAALSKLEADSAREEIRDIVHEIVTIKNLVLSIAEQEDLLDDICNDVLGFGPLEPLLARDDIADIMVNGPTRCFIEVGGKIQLTNLRFRDASQLMNICQRIVSQVGRRVRRILADLRRPPARWLARQCHCAAARDRWRCADDPQVQEGQADARSVGRKFVSLCARHLKHKTTQGLRPFGTS